MTVLTYQCRLGRSRDDPEHETDGCSCTRAHIHGLRIRVRTRCLWELTAASCRSSLNIVSNQQRLGKYRGLGRLRGAAMTFKFGEHPLDRLVVAQQPTSALLISSAGCHSDQRASPTKRPEAAVAPSALAFSYHCCAKATSGAIPFAPSFSSTDGS